MTHELTSANRANFGSLSNRDLERFFPGDSELAARMRTLDWSQTDLGLPQTWSESLRVAVSLCVTSRIPIVMYWGTNFTVLYNDAYISFLGETKHPRYLGQPGQACWQEIWDTIGPMLESVYATGNATLSEDVRMFFARRLPLEEVYVRFTFGPILASDGKTVQGIFCPCTETTEQVVSARRLETLRKLGLRAAEVQTVEAVCQEAARVISENPSDIPFAAIYLVDETGKRARMSASVGFSEDGYQLPLEISTKDDLPALPIASVLRTHMAQCIELGVLAEQLPKGLWSEPVREAIALPIPAAASDSPAGVLLVGVSSRRVLDDAYQTFFDLVTGHIGTVIADARAYEEERKRAEALAEIDRAKTTFFSNVSHEFRTPLTLMLSPLEELSNSLNGQLEPDQREQLQLMQRNGVRLQKLVNTLLDFSRIEAGRTQASYEPTDLATYTAELASVFRSLIEQAGMSLVIDCPVLPEPVYADRDMWEKIVLNLLSNAFKFTFTGSITVRLQPVGSSVELSVTDTGVGIPEAELPRLFERFHRVSGTRSRTYEGSGIGLALVQELVKLHGGTIHATSQVNRGTTFTVAIPFGMAHLPQDRIEATRTLASTTLGANPYVAEASRWLSEAAIEGSESRNAEPSIAAPTQSKQSSTPSARILLVDDNADMRDYVKRLLSQDYEVETVSDGFAALKAVTQQMPNLVLSDVMMPGLDGFGLLRELRADPRTKEIPIILLSARAGEESRLEGLAAGADDYLIKPFSARELLARVEATLKLAHVRQQAETTIREREERLELAEMALQARSAELRHVTEMAGIGLTRCSCDLHYLSANPAYAQLAGMSVEEIVGRPIVEVLGEPAFDVIRPYIDRVLQGERVKYEAQVPFAAGGIRDLYVVYTPDADSKGNVTGWIASIVDISDRKRAELMLVEQKRLLELIATNTPLDDCLTTVCRSISQLNPRIRACFLLADAQGLTFSRSITSDLAPSFGQGLQDAPIDNLCIGTCGEAVYRGEPITCADIANDDRSSQGWRDLCVAHGILACHSTPIIDRDNLPIGSLMLCFDEARQPTAWEHQLAEFGTQIASIAFERDRAQVALRKSEEQFRLFVTASSDMMYRMSADWTEMRNLDGKDFLTSTTNPSRTWLEAYIPPEDQLKVMATIQEAIRTQSIFELEHRIIQSNGTIGWTFSRAIPLLDSQDKILEWFGAASNITARKQAEIEAAANLRDTQLLHDLSVRLVTEDNIQALYQQIMETAIALTHADAGTVHIFDEATQDLLLLATQGFEKVMTDHFYRVNASSHTSGGIAMKSGIRSFVDFDVPASEDPDGSLRIHVEAGYRSAQSTPLISRLGKSIGMVSTHWRTRHRPSDRELRFLDLLARQAADLIEQRQAEQALRESEENLRLFIQQAPVNVVMLDQQMHYITASQRWIDTYQLGSIEAVVGRFHYDLFPNLPDAWLQAHQRCLAGATEKRDEDCFQLSDGSEQWLRWEVRPWYDNIGKIGGILIFAEDITERKWAEQERERSLERERTAREAAETANRIKDEFLAVLSHELRSPLNPILGWSRLLQNSKLDEARTKQALTTIERNAKLQAELIEDLLDVSRILRGKLSLTVSPVNLASTINAALETVRLAAEAKSIAIETLLDFNMGWVSGDATRLQQVMWNLLSNAVKFTPEGGNVTVQLEQVDHQARITVTDTGKGIAPDFLPYVFDYFRQEDGATTRQFGGLGLGLAIVRHLVELHGGTICADSHGEGWGTTFTVNLPLMQLPPKVEQRSQPTRSSPTLQGVHVLVVDDDTDTRDFIEFLLQQTGAIVTTSSSAEEALTALTTLMQFQPDVLLSDIGMPNMDGYMLMQQVRALPPEKGGAVPAIALTAYAGEFDQQQALSVGFQQHVSKPVEPEHLVRAILSLLQLPAP